MTERLQKYMAECGVASRRKCEEIILQGKVRVNGNVVNELGVKIDREKDIVTIDGKVIKLEEQKIYIALNKPEGYISSVKDEKHRKTVLDLVKVKERIYPIGRLDYDTSGLILLTNDGEIYNNIIHPREEKNKEYVALVKGIPSNIKMDNFRNGIDIDGYRTSNAGISIMSTSNGNAKVKIIIHEGKNRQIRKMCEKINHPVISLKRMSIGKIKLGQLPIGQWRYLTESEIGYLKNIK